LRQAAAEDFLAGISNNGAEASVPAGYVKQRISLPERAKKGGPFLGRR